MKKIGVVSFNKYSHHMNYGAVLHSWAFQQYLNRENLDAQIIDYMPKSLEGYNIKYPVLNVFREGDTLRHRVSSFVHGIISFRTNLIKYDKFERFFEQHYKMSNRTYSYNELMQLEKLDEKYDTFICESDVIWKINSTKGFDEVFFLEFPAAKNAVKVAYSPSIGRDSMTKTDELKFLDKIKKFDAISLRERQGSEYVSSLLEKNVDWVLDPTLLLNKSDYERIVSEPAKKIKDYLLVYNCMQNNRRMLKQATVLAKKKGLKLVEISNFTANKYLFNHEVLSSVGVGEYLWYFKNASHIVTNAFHGACFSIIYQKDFNLFLRDNSDFRMQNITSALDLKECLIGLEDSINLHQSNINYQEVEKKLSIHQNRSYSYIKNNIIEENYDK
ncbi:polysaccharide pyruvyl transferase family protein [Vibrio rarus]|uniref:polysaccharide pyruvyl transferase family protein n=1 Tax=Vibrio rarus TaxID=413403 RepID=UPI0021C355BA|nr:polysaccharide pyruvyl transferase family protein [Vibrio rarus]